MIEDETGESHSAVGFEMGLKETTAQEKEPNTAVEAIDTVRRLALMMTSDPETKQATVDGLMALYRTGALSVLALASVVPGEGMLGKVAEKSPKLLRALLIAKKFAPAMTNVSKLHPLLDLTPDTGQEDPLVMTIATAVIPGGGFVDLARQGRHDIPRMRESLQTVQRRLREERMQTTMNSDISRAAKVFNVEIPGPQGPTGQLQALAA